MNSMEKADFEFILREMWTEIRRTEDNLTTMRSYITELEELIENINKNDENDENENKI